MTSLWFKSIYFNNIQPLPWGGGFFLGFWKGTAVRLPYCTINRIPLRGREMTSSLSCSWSLRIHSQGFTLALSSIDHDEDGVKTCYTSTCAESTNLIKSEQQKIPPQQIKPCHGLSIQAFHLLRIQQRLCMLHLSSFTTSNMGICKQRQHTQKKIA